MRELGLLALALAITVGIFALALVIFALAAMHPVNLPLPDNR